MVKKTLRDCAGYAMIARCNAHVSGGTWDHTKGVDPCEVQINDQPNKGG